MTTETALRDAFADVIADGFEKRGLSPAHILVDELADRLVDLCKDVLDLVPAQVKPDPRRREAFEDPHFRQGTLDSGTVD